MKLFQNLTSGFGGEDFLRISSCPYSTRSPHLPEPFLWTDQNFANNFWKGSPKEHSIEIILKSDQQFLRRFFKNYLKNSISLPWQPEFLMESNSVNNFWRGPPKEHSCQVWSKLARQFGRRCLKKLLTTDDGHLTTLKAPLEHFVLRWAKKKCCKNLKVCKWLRSLSAVIPYRLYDRKISIWHCSQHYLSYHGNSSKVLSLCHLLAEKDTFVKHKYPCNHRFWKMWPSYLTLTLTDNLDLGTKEKVLPHGIHMWNL